MPSVDSDQTARVHGLIIVFVGRMLEGTFPQLHSRHTTLKQRRFNVGGIIYGVVLSFVHHLSFFWCLGKVVHRDCGNSWVSSLISFIITKTCPYNFDPLKPHFYIVKLGFTGVCIIFLISAQKHRLWVLVRTALSRRFLRVPQSMF